LNSKRAHSFIIREKNTPNLFSLLFIIEMSTSSLGTSDIVGIAVGGALVVATIIGISISLYTMCCKKNKQSQVWAQSQQPYPSNNAYGQPTNTGYYPQQPNQYSQQPYQYPQQPTWSQQAADYGRPPPYQPANPQINTNGKV
jgi:hypothetical protein